MQRTTSDAQTACAAQPNRRGLTLFEVVLSVAIFLGSMAALSQLIWTGSQASIRSRLQTEAVLRCESTLGEVLAGALPMETVNGAAASDAPDDWVWSVLVAPAPVEGLLIVEVTVSHARVGGVSCTLTRYARDPQSYIDAAIEEDAVESAE